MKEILIDTNIIFDVKFKRIQLNLILEKNTNQNFWPSRSNDE